MAGAHQNLKGAVVPDVVERCSSWAAKREHRLTQQRNKKREEDLEECTFQPQLRSSPQSSTPRADLLAASPTPSVSPPHAPSECSTFSMDVASLASFYDHGPPDRRTPAARSSPPRPSRAEEWACAQHFERIARGRRQRDDKFKGIWPTGSKWKNELTVPQAACLGRRQAVKALEKPVPPPRPGVDWDIDGDGAHAATSDVPADPLTQGAQLSAGTWLPMKGAFSSPVSHAILDAVASPRSEFASWKPDQDELTHRRLDFGVQDGACPAAAAGADGWSPERAIARLKAPAYRTAAAALDDAWARGSATGLGDDGRTVTGPGQWAPGCWGGGASGTAQRWGVGPGDAGRRGGGEAGPRSGRGGGYAEASPRDGGQGHAGLGCGQLGRRVWAALDNGGRV